MGRISNINKCIRCRKVFVYLQMTYCCSCSRVEIDPIQEMTEFFNNEFERIYIEEKENEIKLERDRINLIKYHIIIEKARKEASVEFNRFKKIDEKYFDENENKIISKLSPERIKRRIYRLNKKK